MAQKGLAKLSDISESAMRNYELSDRSPNPEILGRIARALRVRPQYLSIPEHKHHLEFFYALLENDEAQNYSATMFKRKPVIIASIGFGKLLRCWKGMKEKLDVAEIAPDDYKEWKRTYEGTASWVNTPNGESPRVGK